MSARTAMPRPDGSRQTHDAFVAPREDASRIAMPRHEEPLAGLIGVVDFSKREHLTVQPGGTQIVTSERRVTEGLDIVESEADVTDVRLVRSAWVASARAARRPRVVRLTARPRDPSTQERRKAARDSANDRGHIPRRAMRGISQSGRGGRRRGCTRGVGRALHGP
eukprot:5814705-Prymnesium_polylepis.1